MKKRIIKRLHEIQMQIIKANETELNKIGVELLEELLQLDDAWNIVMSNNEKSNAKYDIPIDRGKYSQNR